MAGAQRQEWAEAGARETPVRQEEYFFTVTVVKHRNRVPEQLWDLLARRFC